MKRIFCLFVSAVILLSIVGCHNEKLDKIPSESLTNFIFPIENIYYENADNAFFYGSTIGSVINNEFDFYNIYWLLSTDAILHTGITNQLKSILSVCVENGSICDESQYKYDGVFDIFLRAGIESYFGNRENRGTYIKQLSRYYNAVEKQFKSDNDDLGDSLQLTNNVLNTYISLNYIPDYITDILDRMLEICNTAQYFDESNIDLRRDIISTGMIAIDNIRLIDSLLKSNNSNTLSHLDGWVKKVVANYNSLVSSTSSYDPIVFQGGLLIRNVMEYLDIKVELVPIPEMDFPSIFIHDCQVAYQYALIKKEASSLDKYISSNYKYHIYLNKPIYNLRDVYFGIKIYSILDLPFSKAKLINFVDSFIRNECLSEDDIYYIVKIYEELDITFDTIKAFINNYLFSFDMQDNNITMEKAYQAIYISTKYNLDYFIYDKEEIIVSAMNDVYESDYFSQVYYSYLLLSITEYTIDKDRLFKSISRFQQQKGYRVVISNNATSIYSLYRVFSIYDMENKLGNDEITDFKNKVDQLRAPYGGFFVFNDGTINNQSYETNFTLQAYYYGLAIEAHAPVVK